MKKKVVKMSTFWDDPPPNCENSQLFFSNESFPKGKTINDVRRDWISVTSPYNIISF